eukprot:m.188050 g.188050  ORF g.188050 m.188050 type:complete len:238 (+) comp53593_c0_seq1:46-759(+)
MFTREEVAELIVAVKSKNLGECTRIVLACGSDIVTTPSDFESFPKYTALHWAANNSCTEILEWFLKQHIDYDHVNEEGDTALIIAARWGYTDCLALLLGAGANVTIKDKDGMTALDWVRERGYEAPLALFEERRLAAQQNIKPAPRQPMTDASQDPAQQTEQVAEPVCHVFLDPLPDDLQLAPKIESSADAFGQEVQEAAIAPKHSAPTRGYEQERPNITVPAMNLGLTALDVELLE